LNRTKLGVAGLSALLASFVICKKEKRANATAYLQKTTAYQKSVAQRMLFDYTALVTRG